jgi:hypothetical protein
MMLNATLLNWTGQPRRNARSRSAAAAERWLKEAGEFEYSHENRYFAAEAHRLSALCRAKRGQIKNARFGLRHSPRVKPVWIRAGGAQLFSEFIATLDWWQ